MGLVLLKSRYYLFLVSCFMDWSFIVCGWVVGSRELVLVWLGCMVSLWWVNWLRLFLRFCFDGLFIILKFKLILS